MTPLFTVSASPHIRSDNDINRAMRFVIIALLPAFFGAVYFFGNRVIVVTMVSIASALAAEILGQVVFGRKVDITDGSAIITGLLLVYNLPPAVPFWIPMIGAGFAILIVKQFFGGLGHNFINPALAGRAFLMASWPMIMTKAWLAPRGGTLSGLDGITAATPLSLLKYGNSEIVAQLNGPDAARHLLLGNVGGCIGETSALLLIAGGIFLLILRIIDYRIVIGYLGSVAILTYVLPSKVSVLFQLFSGGLMLGAIFMATDWVTSPITKLGRWLFGIGCGLLTMIIRVWGGYPEGVSYAILLMNLFTPLIDRYTYRRSGGAWR